MRTNIPTFVKISDVLARVVQFTDKTSGSGRPAWKLDSQDRISKRTQNTLWLQIEQSKWKI